ncbi:MAG: hypothetical protein L0I76_16210 [Pseudonocardia sp.]|nr:hypothetical protein [Pseudonocardia sp.]
MTAPAPGSGEPRDVWPLRQEMRHHLDGNQAPQFTPADILARLDVCPTAPDHTALLRECFGLLMGPPAAVSAWMRDDLGRRIEAALNETEN